MNAVPVLVGYALRGSVRSRVFLVVVALTFAVGTLYALGVSEAFEDVERFSQSEVPANARELTGAMLIGLATFSTLLLGAVLAAFLTIGAISGEAERGLLQPLVVRPVGRTWVLLARFAAATGVAAGYAVAVHLASVLVVGAVAGWWPDRVVGPALDLALAVTVVAALSLLGSVFLSAAANGVAVFMLFTTGLLAGLLAQVGRLVASTEVERLGEVASWVLPFEALYQRALGGIVVEPQGSTRIVLDLGPLGAAQSAGPALTALAAGYVVVLCLAAALAFRRRDL